MPVFGYMFSNIPASGWRMATVECRISKCKIIKIQKRKKNGDMLSIPPVSGWPAGKAAGSQVAEINTATKHNPPLHPAIPIHSEKIMTFLETSIIGQKQCMRSRRDVSTYS